MMSSTTSHKQNFILADVAVEHLLWLSERQGAGFLCIRIFSNGTLRRTAFFNNRDNLLEDQLRAFLKSDCRHGDHIFYSVNSFSEKKAKAKYCVAGRLLHVDADGVSVPPPGPMPTRVVKSSPGNHHFLYVLKDAVYPEDAQKLSRQMTTLVDGDKGGHSPAKLLRLPGTLNAKY